MQKITLPIQVWHYPQVPCEPFKVNVRDEREAYLVAETLAHQHLWLFENKMIPDYSNSIVVVMLENGQWVDYYNDTEGMEWAELAEQYLVPENINE